MATVWFINAHFIVIIKQPPEYVSGWALFQNGNPHTKKYVYILLGQLNCVDKLCMCSLSKMDVYKQWQKGLIKS